MGKLVRNLGVVAVKQGRMPRVRQTMDNLISDLRYALRTFARNPAFTAVAVVSLALGIGVNVVIFSVVNTALEKPIAGVTEPDRLMRVYRGSHSPLAFQDFQYSATVSVRSTGLSRSGCRP
jgi:hypothetical protein